MSAQNPGELRTTRAPWRYGASRVQKTGSWIQGEATLMESEMNSEPRNGVKQPWLGIGRALFVIILFVLILLLGQSMVSHRFFQGERVHQNGSIGQ